MQHAIFAVVVFKLTLSSVVMAYIAGPLTKTVGSVVTCIFDGIVC